VCRNTGPRAHNGRRRAAPRSLAELRDAIERQLLSPELVLKLAEAGR
jgi:hypothetical protein